MKYLPSQLMYLTHDKQARRNFRSLAKFLVFLFLCVLLYSVLFHVIMEMEGKNYSFITGFYWTLTVMSTLGFGDITFSSDLGRVFSLVVLLSGIIFLLIMLPFTFIQFFYAPYLEAKSTSRVPRELPWDTSGHMIIIGFDLIARSLAERLALFHYDYVILVPELQQALELLDQDYRVVLGEYDDPGTYERLQAANAAMVVAVSDDMKNTNAVSTIRETAPKVPVVANAEMEDSIDILQLAGATHVFQFMKMLGETLAQRTRTAGAHCNLVGSFDGLVLAEAPAASTPFVGSTVRDSGLREATGLNIVGLLQRGELQPPLPETRIGSSDVLILAGSQEQLDTYKTYIQEREVKAPPVLLIGGGRVGHAAAEALESRGLDYRIVEKSSRIMGPKILNGDASDFDVLVAAGIREAPSVLVTTHNDDLNIYLTIYCRKLRPDIQIISRATMDRNITVLHKAGADLVMSYATLAATTVVNQLHPDKIFMLTEGLDVFKVKTPPVLEGKSLAKSGIRQETGCSVIAVIDDKRNREPVINPGPDHILHAGNLLILAGSTGAQERYMKTFPE